MALVGGPKMGKTTLSRLSDGRPVIHSVHEDEEIDAASGSILVVGGYEPETPMRLMAAAHALPSFIVEGVQVARALRGPKVDGIRYPGLAVDYVVYLERPKVPEMLSGQIAQTVGTRTIFNGWREANPHIPVFFESSLEGLQ